MNLRSKNRINPEFNMSSMTDIIFLLLIFFMLTSNFVATTGMPVSLPTSKASDTIIQKISITITKDLEYYLNEQPIAFAEIEPQLTALLQGTEQGAVVLHVDKTVPVEHLVNVAGIAKSLNASVTLATSTTE
ncbi:ExbD/TolR family protein [Pontibacter arcticus]|uniref:Biopolymer transporter ExbD n=1 Tax=Pontibacter arcticus TaxID=2080288 RepID=A0A364RG73_9BACT|nr:biopolymer transporter ExbD [Pontibacter arcticus]RAU83340.1 biopolymer transporter ExbD [Pontibacter arcticus]